MKIRTAALATAATVVTAGAVGIADASIAAADADTHALGSQATLTDGNVVQGWTISDLQQSSDTLSYPVQGTLWEATATDEAVQGSATPIVANFNARSASGQTYRVLYQVATPEGVNPTTLAPGEKTTGKVYFDVTGDNPNSVVYNAGGTDLATWVQSAPPSGRSTSTPAGGSSAPAASSASSAPAGSATTPAPAANPETPAGTAPAGAPTTEAPTGSQGTPIPEGSQGTPITEGTQETPATQAPEGTSEAPAGTPATPAPGGAQQAPGTTEQVPGGTQHLPGAAPGVPAPATPNS